MIVVELFPCSGGMAEGLRRAGIEITMAFDRDPDACASYEANMGHAPIRLDVRDLLRMARAGWRPSERVDLIVADPPCTSWSRAGKRRGLEDDLDMLLETVEFVRLLAPERWLIANVPGLGDGPNWPTVQRTIGSLSKCGREHPPYCIDFARLDAADYGVPQRRIRPFWFGHRPGAPCIRWPERTHGSPEEVCTSTIPGVRELIPWVTCRQALGHLSGPDVGTPVRLRWRGKDARARRHHGKKARASNADEPTHVVTAGLARGDGAVLFDGRNPHEPSRPDRPARTLTTNAYGDGALLAHPRHPASLTGNGGPVLEWPRDRPATTVHTGNRLAPQGRHDVSFLSDNLGHGPNAVKLSEKALAILQGFPSRWVFRGKTKTSRHSQIGQAMPPPLAEVVGRSIALALNIRQKSTGSDH